MALLPTCAAGAHGQYTLWPRLAPTQPPCASALHPFLPWGVLLVMVLVSIAWSVVKARRTPQADEAPRIRRPDETRVRPAAKGKRGFIVSLLLDAFWGAVYGGVGGVLAAGVLVVPRLGDAGVEATAMIVLVGVVFVVLSAPLGIGMMVCLGLAKRLVSADDVLVLVVSSALGGAAIGAVVGLVVAYIGEGSPDYVLASIRSNGCQAAGIAAGVVLARGGTLRWLGEVPAGAILGLFGVFVANFVLSDVGVTREQLLASLPFSGAGLVAPLLRTGAIAWGVCRRFPSENGTARSDTPMAL